MFSESNYTWTGSKAENASGKVAALDWFVKTDFEDVQITRGKSGMINLNGLFELTDKAPADAGARLYYNEQLDQAMYDLIVAESLEEKYNAIRAIDAHLKTMTDEQKEHLELGQYNKAVDQYNAYLPEADGLTETYNNMFGLQLLAGASLLVVCGLVVKFALRG